MDVLVQILILVKNVNLHGSRSQGRFGDWLSLYFGSFAASNYEERCLQARGPLGIVVIRRDAWHADDRYGGGELLKGQFEQFLYWGQ